MINKKLTILCAGVLAAAGLAGCGGGAKGIMIWAPSEEQPVIRTIIDDYNEAHPDDKIEYRFKATEEGTASSDVEKDPKTANYPSLFASVDDHLTALAIDTRVAAKIPSATAEQIKETTVDSAVTSASVNGELYAYPISVDNGYFLYYDTDFFSASEVGTLEGMLEKAAAQNKQFLMDMPNGYYSASIFLSPEVMGLQGIGYTREGSGDDAVIKYNMDWGSTKAATAAKAFSDLIVPYTSGTAKTFISGDNTAIATGAANGTLVACVSGTWVMDALTTGWGEGKVGTAKLPTVAGNQLASFVGAKNYVVNSFATAEEQADAHKIAQLLTSKEGQLIRYQIRSAVPCNIEAQEDPIYADNKTPAVAGLEAQAPYGAVQSQCVESLYWPIGETIGRVIMQGYYGDGQTQTKLQTVEKWSAYLNEITEPLVDPSKRVTA